MEVLNEKGWLVNLFGSSTCILSINACIAAIKHAYTTYSHQYSNQYSDANLYTYPTYIHINTQPFF